MIRQISWLLSLDLSPEQIAGRLSFEDYLGTVSRQTVYRHIEYMQCRHLLPRKGKKYRHSKGAEAGVRMIPNRVDIDERP